MSKKKITQKNVSYNIISDLALTDVQDRLQDYLVYTGYEEIFEGLYNRDGDTESKKHNSPRGLDVQMDIEAWEDAEGKSILKIVLTPINLPSGILLTGPDWEYWEIELLELEKAVQTGEISTIDSEQMANKASRLGKKIDMLVGVFVIALIALGLFAYIGSIFNF